MLSKEWEKKFGKILDDYMNNSVDDNKLKKLDEIHANIKKKLIEMEESRQLRKRARKKVFKGVGIFTACVVGFFILMIAVPSIPQVQAFRFNFVKSFTEFFHPTEEIDQNGNVTKHYSSIDEMNNDLGVNLPEFGWVPDGLKLTDIHVQKDVNNVLRTANYGYREESGDNFIDIGIVYLGNDLTKSQFNSSTNVDEYTVNEMEIAISKDEPYIAHFYYNDQFIISITTNLDKDDA